MSSSSQAVLLAVLLAAPGCVCGASDPTLWLDAEDAKLVIGVDAAASPTFSVTDDDALRLSSDLQLGELSVLDTIRDLREELASLRRQVNETERRMETRMDEAKKWVDEEIEAVQVQAGDIRLFGGSAALDNDRWLLCDGRAVPRGLYHQLFDAIGTTWGSEMEWYRNTSDPNTFKLPNFKGKVPVGWSAAAAAARYTPIGSRNSARLTSTSQTKVGTYYSTPSGAVGNCNGNRPGDPTYYDRNCETLTSAGTIPADPGAPSAAVQFYIYTGKPCEETRLGGTTCAEKYWASTDKDCTLLLLAGYDCSCTPC